jgi:Fe-S-cluster containining protein
VSELVQIGRFNFRFQCQSGCTNCCTQPGEVYLAADDAERIAAHLGVTRRKFLSRYCETDVDGDLRLSTPARKHCHFLTEAGCSIHQVKPLQCRTFPFWPEHVKNKSAWKNLKQYCPGIGVGPVLPMEGVRAEAQRAHEAFPDS